MPKIRTETIHVQHKDIRRTFQLNLMYNGTDKFNIVIPEEYHEIINHLEDKELEANSVSCKAKSKTSREPIYFTHAETEEECLQRTKKFLHILTDKEIVQRNVILVFYNQNNVGHYGTLRHNKEHPQIGMKYGLTYAVETSVADKKVYSLYIEKQRMDGTTWQDRLEISLWNELVTVIPDTPENRKVLEDIYNAFINLNEKMKTFTKNSDSMLEFIQSKVKMLEA